LPKRTYRGEVCEFLLGKIDISHHCKEQDFEICAIQLITKISILIILCNVNEFLRRPDATLKYLYNPKPEFTICGDTNINYLNKNNQKQVSSLLKHTIFYTL
jgi:hypothetical protein